MCKEKTLLFKSASVCSFLFLTGHIRKIVRMLLPNVVEVNELEKLILDILKAFEWTGTNLSNLIVLFKH